MNGQREVRSLSIEISSGHITDRFRYLTSETGDYCVDMDKGIENRIVALDGFWIVSHIPKPLILVDPANTV
jgi:hypothetical protein